jgi:hypothetical protein
MLLPPVCCLQAAHALQVELRQQQAAAAKLELQLLQQEAAHLQQLHAREAAVSEACMSVARDAAAALASGLQELQLALAGTHDPGASGGPETGSPRHRWLHGIVQALLSNVQRCAAHAQATAALRAARRCVGMQSDEPQQAQWLQWLQSLPDVVVAQPLAPRAAAEAVVRVYLRGLSQLEVQGLLVQQQQPSPAAAAGGSGVGAVGSVSVSGSGSMPTLFDTLMQHYALPQAPGSRQGGRLAVQAHSAALWQDPQGPITRLLVSCRGLAPTSVKVALFCCLAGTHTLLRGAWGVQHWRQLLLLLHAVRQLTGGLWKGLLREWASPRGALLPLQCVLDLLANVYNTNSVAALEQQPALLGSCAALLQAVSGGCAAGSCGDSASRGSSRGSSRDSTQDAASGAAAGGVRCRQGSVAAALQELVVDGPLGPGSAVGCDELLGMLLVQFDAGLLPLHPLLQPRRLTTGDLANTSNAWGSAAADAHAGLRPAHPAPLNMELLDGARRAEWAGLPSPSGFSSVGGGWISRPTTASPTPTASAGGGARLGTPGSQVGGAPASHAGAAPTLLPRIRTPDSPAGSAGRPCISVQRGLAPGMVSRAGRKE